MEAADTAAAEFTLALSEEERAQLLSFLEQLLREKQVEARRTEASDFWKHIHHQEALLEGLVNKLRR